MTRSRRLYFLLGLAVLLLCAAAAAPRARALWAQLPSGEWIEAADCAARREAPAPGRDALHVRAGMRPARGCTGTVVAELRRPRADGGWEVEASFRGGVRLDARLPGTPAEGCRLRVVFRAWRGSELMEERVLESGRAGLCSRPLPMMPKGVSSAAMLPGKSPFFVLFLCGRPRHSFSSASRHSCSSAACSGGSLG